MRAAQQFFSTLLEREAMTLPAKLDEPLVELLRSPRSIPEHARKEPSRVLRRAELHGLTGVVTGILTDAGVELPPALNDELRLRAVARELDYEAHRGAFRRIDRVFATARIDAVGLKGCLFAERYYDVPSGRATSDTDLMIAEADIDRASKALRSIGYVPEEGPEEDRFRREHHHLHFTHPAAPPLELHFHAYRGFGSVLRSEALIARRERLATLEHGAVGVLSKPDELVYLSVHAAAHRFVRLGWLYDIGLLVERMSPDELEVAHARARASGYARLLAFALSLLHDVFGAPTEASSRGPRLGRLRGRLARHVVAEPSRALKRSATRFIYTATLCDSFAASVRYASHSSLGRARELFTR